MKLARYVLFTLAFLLLLIAGLWQFEYLQAWFSPQGEVNPQTLVEQYDSTATVALFNNQAFAIEDILASLPLDDQVLGDQDIAAPAESKRIFIDLSHQRLYAFEGNQLVYSFLVSTGKWGRTPTGTFRIWTKLRFTKMEGGSQALRTYYYLPNVPYTMFFSNDEISMSRGYGIHGTYWHDNFGHPMSHGCINMKTEEVEQLYYWANPVLGDQSSIRATADNLGTEVIIYGEAPVE